MRAGMVAFLQLTELPWVYLLDVLALGEPLLYPYPYPIHNSYPYPQPLTPNPQTQPQPKPKPKPKS